MDVYLPDQTLSDKTKQSEEWYVPTYDYWIYQCTNSKNNKETMDMIKAASGEVPFDTLDYLLKPFNEDGEQLNKKYPINVRNTDIITPIVEKVVGEYIELPYNYTVKFHDSDISSMQDGELRIIMEDIIKTSIVESMQAQQQAEGQQQEGQPQQPQQPDPEEIKKLIDQKKKEFLQNETLKATRFLTYINEKTDFDYYRYQMYYNWWTTEECYVHRTIEDGTLVKDIISPQNGFPYTGSADFVEDGMAFTWVESYNIDEIFAKDRDKLSKEQLTYLESLIGVRNISTPIYASNHLIEERSRHNWYRIENLESVNNYLTETSRDITKFNIVFVAYRKVKELRYFDSITNKEKLVIVPYNYFLNSSLGDIAISNKLIPEVYYGARYGNEQTGIYTKPEKLLVQRDGKLPVTGKKGILKNKKINPIPFRLMAYQVIDSMLTIHIEKTLNKYKDDILIIPKGALAEDKSGTTAEKTYYMMKDGRLIYDEEKVDFQHITSGMRLIQGSATDKYLSTLIDIQKYFLNRGNQVASMNDDRMGNIDTRSGVGNVEQNIYRSKLGNVLSLEVFRKILQKEHEADLEYAKYLFIDGVNDTMFDDKGDVVSIEVNGYSNFKRTYGVHIDNAMSVDKKLNQIRQLAASAAQNGDMDQAMEAIESDNIAEIKLAVQKSKQAQQDFEREMKQMETEREQVAQEGAKEQLDIARQTQTEMISLKGEIDENKVIVEKEYDLAMTELKLNTDLTKEEINAETIRVSNQSRERIARAKEQNNKDIARIKEQNKQQKSK